MIILLSFAFIAGIVTVISPCILPMLPIILSSADGSKQRPAGVVVGFVASFTFFTLFLSTIVQLLGVPAGQMRLVSVVVLFVFGLALLIPQLQVFIERGFSRLSSRVPTVQNKQGFIGGLLIGLSLGLLWTPCVGPILAAVISLALSGSVTFVAFLITLAYAIGTALPMFAIMWAGSSALRRVPWLVRNIGTIQQVFGLLMVVTALAVYFNIDRMFQEYVLQVLPNYADILTSLEDNQLVDQQLEAL